MSFPLSRKVLFGALALAFAMAMPAYAQQKSVAITAIVEHPALDSVRDGVKEALAAAGYEDGKNLKWQYQSAQGNTGTAAQIARKFVGDKADVIVAIATPSAQAVAAATKDIPLVFSAVTDPVVAKLVPSMQPSGTNVTGVSDALELGKQVELIKRVVPAAKRVGIVYNPGEANSVVVVEQLRELLPKHGLSLVEAAAPRSVDVGSAARSLIGKADVFYTSTDNNVVSAYEALVKVGMDAKIPLVAADTDSVARGAVAAYGMDYKALGVQTGEIVVRILKGEKPGAIASETSNKLSLQVNPAAAQKQGIGNPPMSLYTLLGALEIGLIFSLVALGVYISFRLLRFPDLTVDGSFPLGGAVAATMIAAGHDPFTATIAATLAGAIAGLITGWLNVSLKIMDLLASILMMIALYSINLRIMGKPNVPLITEPTVFNLLQPEALADYVFRPLLLVFVVLAVKLALDGFFATQSGLAIRATGSNARMARAQGVNTGMAILAGMALSNALVGLAGALFAQTQGGADISMGVGTIVIGLAAVIVGESLLPSRKLYLATIAVIVGAIVYRFFIALALNSDFIGLQAQDLNLVTAVLVTVALVVPRLRAHWSGKRVS